MERVCGISVGTYIFTSKSLPNESTVSFVTVHLYVLVNIPIEGIRLLDAMCLLLGKDAVLGKRRCVPFAAVWSQPGVICSEKVTFDPLTR